MGRCGFALLIFTPVIVWNAQHHWASFLFQGGRAGGYGNFPKLKQFLGNLGGQILYLAPWIFVPMVAAAYQALRSGSAAERSWYCLCLAIPTILLFTVVPLWGEHGLPHWQMPGWLMLYPVLGDYLAREAAVRRRPRTWVVSSAAVRLFSRSCSSVTQQPAMVGCYFRRFLQKTMRPWMFLNGHRCGTSCNGGGCSKKTGYSLFQKVQSILAKLIRRWMIQCLCKFLAKASNTPSALIRRRLSAAMH